MERLGCVAAHVVGSSISADADVMDVVVVGGGFLGLTTLATFRHAGYRACLVTESLVGEGQSLHSHGWFHAGYLPGTAADAKMWKEESSKSEAMVARLGADFLRPGRAFRALQSGAAADSWAAQAAKIGVPLRKLSPGELPDSAGGPLSEPSNTVFEMREWLFAKEKLAALLAQEHSAHIHSGSAVVGFELDSASGAVKSVALSTGHRLHTRAVAVAAGTGTRGVVDQLGPAVAEEWKDKFQSGTITMVCLKAPAAILPDIATMVSVPEAPLQTAAKLSADGSTVTWYITPKRPEDGGGLTKLSQPGPAEATDEAESVRHAVADFRTLFPAIATAVDAEPSSQWGVYTGYVQRVQGHPGGPYVETVPGVSNCVVSAPSLIHMISGTAERVLQSLSPLLGAPRASVPHTLGEGVNNPSAAGRSGGGGAIAIGVPNEEREEFQYSSWTEFAAKFGITR